MGSGALECRRERGGLGRGNLGGDFGDCCGGSVEFTGDSSKCISKGVAETHGHRGRGVASQLAVRLKGEVSGDPSSQGGGTFLGIIRNRAVRTWRSSYKRRVRAISRL